jgi:hypothetical protein
MDDLPVIPVWSAGSAGKPTAAGGLTNYSQGAFRYCPERFRAKWRPVRVKKTRQTKD